MLCLMQHKIIGICELLIYDPVSALFFLCVCTGLKKNSSVGGRDDSFNEYQISVHRSHYLVYTEHGFIW